VRIRLTASSIRAWVTSPFATKVGQIVLEVHVLVGDHHHVDPRVDADFDVGLVVGTDLVDALPVTDDDPLKPNWFFNTPVIMSRRACILIGAVSLPRIRRLEYDGMTEPTSCCCTAA